MSRFCDLDAPRQATLGWYVICSAGVNDYLHDDGQVHKGTQDGFYISTGYFPSEHAAHKSAERYYLTHCRKYPYTSLLNSSQEVNEGSQIMEFES